MFFPGAPVSVNTVSFRATLQGIAGQPNDRSENVIEYNDGSLDVIVFDGRQEISSKINIPFSTTTVGHDEFIVLKDYLQENSGNEIEITLETGDELFGPRFLNPTAFAQITEVSPTGEQEFSIDRKLFDIGLGLNYLGTTSGARLNVSSKKDWKIEVQTNARGADFIVPDEAARLALSASVNQWAFQQDNFTLYIFLDPLWQQEATLTSTTKVLLNNADLNFIDGKFQWSLFTPHAIPLAQSVQNNPNFEPGFVSFKSFNIPQKKIDIRKGGNFEQRLGGNFSLVNSKKLHAIFTNLEISLFGASVTIWSFDDEAPGDGDTKIFSFVVESTNFGVDNYTINCKPQALLSTRKFPDDKLNTTDYPILDPEKEGDTALQTYGRWLVGELQETSFKTDQDEFSPDNFFTRVFSADTVVINTVTYQRITFDLSFSDFSQVGFDNLPLDAVTTQPLFFITLKTSASWQIGVNGGVLGYTNNSGKLAFFLAEDTFKVEVFENIFVTDSTADQSGSFLTIAPFVGDPIGDGQVFNILEPGGFPPDTPIVEGAIVASYNSDLNIIRFTEPLGSDIPDNSNLFSQNLLDVGDTFSLFKQGISFAADSELIEGFDVDNGDGSVTIKIYTKDSNGELIELNSDKFTVLNNGKNNIIFLPAENLNINGDGTFKNETITLPSSRVKLEVSAGINFFLSRVGPLWNIVTRQKSFFVEIPTSSNQFSAVQQVTISDEIDLLLTSGEDSTTTSYLGKNIATGATGGSYQDKWEAFTPAVADFPTTVFQSFAIADETQSPAINGNEALAAYGISSKTISTPNASFDGGFFQVNYGSKVSTFPDIEPSSLMTSWSYKINDDAKLSLRDKENVSMLVSFSVLYGDSDFFGNLDKSLGRVIGDWQVKSNINVSSSSFTTVQIEGVGIDGFDSVSNSGLILDNSNKGFIKCFMQNYNSIAATVDIKSVDSGNFFLSKGYKLRQITASNFGDTGGILKISGYDSLTNTKVQLTRLECFNANTGYNTDTENQYIFMNLPSALGGRDEDFNDTANKDEDGITIPIKVGDVGFAQGFHFRGSNLLEIPDSIFENGGALFNSFSDLIFEFYNKKKINRSNNDTSTAGSSFAQNQLFGHEFLLGQGVVNGTTIDSRVSDGNNIYFTFNENVDLINRPAFVKVNGKIDTTLIENPFEIARNISIQSPLSPDPSATAPKTDEDINDRNKWLLRKQYSKSVRTIDVIKDINRQSQTASIMDEDDNIKFVSIDLDDKVSKVEFNDSNIIKDSMQKIAHRKASDIFQKFTFPYNWDPAKKKNVSQISLFLDGDGDLVGEGLTNEELATYRPILEDFFRVSRSFYQMNNDDNALEVNLNMFYDLQFADLTTDPASFPFTPRQSLINAIPRFIKHNIFNAWTMKFKVHEKWFTFGSGIDKLTLGDKVDVNTFFESDLKVVEGIITGITPDVYSGTWTIEVYSTRPPDATLGINDFVWDGGVGEIDSVNFQIKTQGQWPFKDPNQIGSFPDGREGDISNNLNEFEFTDGTLADNDEEQF